MIGKLIHAAFSETKTFSDVWEEVKENPTSAFASAALDVGLCFIPGAGWGAVAARAAAVTAFAVTEGCMEEQSWIERNKTYASEFFDDNSYHNEIIEAYFTHSVFMNYPLNRGKKEGFPDEEVASFLIKYFGFTTNPTVEEFKQKLDSSTDRFIFGAYDAFTE